MAEFKCNCCTRRLIIVCSAGILFPILAVVVGIVSFNFMTSLLFEPNFCHKTDSALRGVQNYPTQCYHNV